MRQFAEEIDVLACSSNIYECGRRGEAHVGQPAIFLVLG